jgi:hypothetical protein
MMIIGVMIIDYGRVQIEFRSRPDWRELSSSMVNPEAPENTLIEDESKSSKRYQC